MAIHHITEEMVEGAPLLSEVIGRYLGADAYVAHNAKFDKARSPAMGNSVDLHCTKLARSLLPEHKSHSNQYLRYSLGLKPEVPEGFTLTARCMTATSPPNCCSIWAAWRNGLWAKCAPSPTTLPCCM